VCFCACVATSTQLHGTSPARLAVTVAQFKLAQFIVLQWAGNAKFAVKPAASMSSWHAGYLALFDGAYNVPCRFTGLSGCLSCRWHKHR